MMTFFERQCWTGVKMALLSGLAFALLILVHPASAWWIALVVGGCLLWAVIACVLAIGAAVWRTVNPI